MDPARDELTIYVAAGGRGRRLGLGPKAGVRAGPDRFIDLVLDELAGLPTFVVGNPRVENVRVPVVPDRIPDRGVPGALDAALAHCRTPWAMLVGVDMPSLRREAVAHLAGLRRPGVDAVVPVSSGRSQPLHALYRVVTCAPVARDVARGRGGALEVLRRVRVLEVDLGLLSGSLADVDTPRDLLRLGQRARDAQNPPQTPAEPGESLARQVQILPDHVGSQTFRS